MALVRLMKGEKSQLNMTTSTEEDLHRNGIDVGKKTVKGNVATSRIKIA